MWPRGRVLRNVASLPLSSAQSSREQWHDNGDMMMLVHEELFAVDCMDVAEITHPW